MCMGAPAPLKPTANCGTRTCEQCLRLGAQFSYAKTSSKELKEPKTPQTHQKHTSFLSFSDSFGLFFTFFHLCHRPKGRSMKLVPNLEALLATSRRRRSTVASKT